MDARPARLARRPRPGHALLLGAGAAVVGLLGSAGIVWQASYSAFSATTSNATNNWTAGSVTLTDDDSGTAMFNATGLKPSATGSKCIAVTSTGSLPSTVKLYGTAPTTTNNLAASITLTVTQGTGATFASCTGFTPLGTGSSVYSGSLAAFGTANTNFSNGAGTWAPTGSASETRVYKFDYTLDAAAPNSTQSGTASIGFTWEAQNT